MLLENDAASLDSLQDNSELNKYKANDNHRVPTIKGIIIIGLLFGNYGIIYLIDGILPTALSIADEKDSPGAFIAERAQQDLKFLTDIGPRVVGSYENEVQAVEFLKKKINIIQKQAHRKQKLELDVQIVTGVQEMFYDLDVYANVQNIVVKLHSENNSRHSLLINSHFDSVPTSPGGSDDGINCAVMLEVLRKLSRSPERFHHNIIFLFNGAEETGLQAAHGFISQHKWAKEVRAVVNLDSAGAGGKILLFQAGPEQPWLLDYYQKVPYPNAQVAVEEFYEYGFAYGDTDFSIFKKIGIVGLDFAFISDRYRYHTKFDGFSNIPPGSFQHVGANTLSLVRHLANAPELSDPENQPKSRTIYYDFLGLFMISYTETIAIIIHAVISALSLTVAVKCFCDFKLGFLCESVLYLAMAFSAILLGWIAAGLFVTAIAFSINALHFSMSWYNNSWIILGLYVTPVFTSSCAVIALFNHFKLNKYKASLSINAQAQIQANLLRLIWTIILVMGTALRLRSTYLVLIPVLFHTIAFATIQIFCLQHSIRKWQIIYYLGTTIPTIFLMKQALTFATFIVPLFGDIGFLINSELYIGILALILTLLITSVFMPIITLIRKPFLLLAILTGIFLIFFIIVFTPLGFPYSGDPDSPAPQRVEIGYVWVSEERINSTTNNTYEKVSKFILFFADDDPRDASFKNQIEYINKILNPNVEDNARQEVISWNSISTEELADDNYVDVSLTLNSKKSVTNSLTNFNFTVSDPPNLGIIISLKDNTTLTAVNIQSPAYTAALNISSDYVLYYTWAQSKTPLTFSLNFKTPVNRTRPAFEINLFGTYHCNINSQYYTKFLNELPDWVNLDTTRYISKTWIY